MLSDEEINLLFKEGKLFKESDFKKRDERSIIFFRENGKEQLENDKIDLWDRMDVYFFTDPEIDVWIKENIDNGVEDFFEGFIRENKDEIKNKLELSLPYKEARIKELEKCFNDYLTLLKSEIRADYEYSYLELPSLIKQRKTFYYSQSDNFLNYDKQTKTLSFEFAYSYYTNKMEDKDTYINETHKIAYLKTLKWIKQQILIEKGETKEERKRQINNPYTGTKEEFISLINGLMVAGKENFKNYFKHFNYKLSDYPGTQIIFDELKTNFLNKFHVSLDKDFLIEAELSNYDRYQNYKQIKERKYSNDFVLRGFFWITTGEEIFIKDFYLLQNGTYEYFKDSFPINEDSLLRRWMEVSNNIEQAAKGCAYGLYVHYLKHFKEKEMILNDEEKEIIKDSTNEPLLETIQTSNQKLKWNGTPSQFGFIIDLLIQGGYLEKPTSSFSKDANFYLQFFDIETTNSTLAKELSEGTNSLATKNRNKIIIPNKDKLD